LLGLLACGVLSGGAVAQLLSDRRDRRWVNAQLIPEAIAAGIDFGWLLALLAAGVPRGQADDELRGLRPVAPLVRAELTRSGKTPDELAVGFEPL
jgi:hypothetical protein